MTTATINTTAILDETTTAMQAETSLPDTVQANGTFSITSFVLGVVSIVAGWSFIAPIVGLVLGIIALRRKSAERTLALWGVWLNGAMLAISTLIALGIFAIMALGFFGGAYTGIWG